MRSFRATFVKWRFDSPVATTVKGSTVMVYESEFAMQGGMKPGVVDAGHFTFACLDNIDVSPGDRVILDVDRPIYGVVANVSRGIGGVRIEAVGDIYNIALGSWAFDWATLSTKISGQTYGTVKYTLGTAAVFDVVATTQIITWGDVWGLARVSGTGVDADKPQYRFPNIPSYIQRRPVFRYVDQAANSAAIIVTRPINAPALSPYVTEGNRIAPTVFRFGSEVITADGGQIVNGVATVNVEKAPKRGVDVYMLQPISARVHFATALINILSGSYTSNLHYAIDGSSFREAARQIGPIDVELNILPAQPKSVRSVVEDILNVAQCRLVLESGTAALYPLWHPILRTAGTLYRSRVDAREKSITSYAGVVVISTPDDHPHRYAFEQPNLNREVALGLDNQHSMPSIDAVAERMLLAGQDGRETVRYVVVGQPNQATIFVAGTGTYSLVEFTWSPVGNTATISGLAVLPATHNPAISAGSQVLIDGGFEVWDNGTKPTWWVVSYASKSYSGRFGTSELACMLWSGATATQTRGLGWSLYELYFGFDAVVRDKLFYELRLTTNGTATVSLTGTLFPGTFHPAYALYNTEMVSESTVTVQFIAGGAGNAYIDNVYVSHNTPGLYNAGTTLSGFGGRDVWISGNNVFFLNDNFGGGDTTLTGTFTAGTLRADVAGGFAVIGGAEVAGTIESISVNYSDHTATITVATRGRFSSIRQLWYENTPVALFADGEAIWVPTEKPFDYASRNSAPATTVYMPEDFGTALRFL